MMDTNCHLEELIHLNHDPKIATKIIVEILFDKLYPTLLRIKNKLDTSTTNEDDVIRLKDLYNLTASQIRKCFIHLFDVFKLEHNQQLILQENRQFTVERLAWCTKKLATLESHLDKLLNPAIENHNSSNDSFLINNLYFVNWIDHTFEILGKLADIISNLDYRETEDVPEVIKIELVECMSNLYVSLDELLLSAMTICRYCLSSDQHIVKARCQVVLRETKALLNELMEGDCDNSFQADSQKLKLPIMPSNINVLIDVLKDVLYALETNTNTALLALLIHCFSYSVSPVDVLKQHFSSNNKDCVCANVDDTADDCVYVKDFDFYNERLLQIGSFAVSCSSDQSRIIALRSGLASLEALDPHLVPSLMISTDSLHASLLVDSWKKEVQEIRDSVFLIVDPGAFSEKSRQIIHQKVLELSKEGQYNNSSVCEVINIGNVVYDFFAVYNNYEPEALGQRESLLPLLTDLRKVIMECKIVSNILSSGNDFIYNVKKVNKNKKDATFEQLLKRLKLLYSVINKINLLLHPKENEDQFFDFEDEQQAKNATHTVCGNVGHTYVNSPKKAILSKSIFARTTNIRSSTINFPLAKLMKQFKVNKEPELSFTTKLDQLFNDVSDVEGTDKKDEKSFIINKYLEKVREPSILYKSPMKNRSSLRKVVLKKHKFALENEKQNFNTAEVTTDEEKPSIMDDVLSLQITDVLNQLNDITIMSTTKDFNLTRSVTQQENNHHKAKSNILRINVNKQNTPVSKQVWKIPVNTGTKQTVLDETVNISSDTQNSVTSIERLNDLNLVESKLNSLKTCLFETSL